MCVCVFVVCLCYESDQGERSVFLLQSRSPNEGGGRNCPVSQNQALAICVCMCVCLCVHGCVSRQEAHDPTTEA